MQVGLPASRAIIAYRRALGACLRATAISLSILGRQTVAIEAQALKRTPALLLALLVVLGGCTTVTSLDGRSMRMRSDEFRTYVESVFRRQNEVATELAFALEATDFGSAQYVELESAESALLDACAWLNETAARRQSGQATQRLRAAREARNTPACERAAAATEQLLDRIN